MDELLEKNQSLEIEVLVLRQKLVEMADPRFQPSEDILRLLSSSKTTPQIGYEITPDSEQNSVVLTQQYRRLHDSLRKYQSE